MENSPQAESLIAVESEFDALSSGWTPTDDQRFLLYFIMGTYFAPDVKGESHLKPVLQRRAEGLTQYTADQLGGSRIKTVEVERVYYNVLRKADQSVIVKLPWLRQFFHGNLPNPTQDPLVAYPQFDDLFPPHLHPFSLNNGYRTIDNIAFINNPDTFYTMPNDFERFKRLTGLEDVFLDRDASRLHILDGEVLFDVKVREMESNGELPPLSSFATVEGKHSDDLNPVNGAPYNGTPPVNSISQNGEPHATSVLYNGSPLALSYMSPIPTEMKASQFENFGSGMIFFPSRPTREEWSNILAATKGGSALTGSAANGQIGPVLGVLDIGECEDSYLFRVSLPGVKRDEREFSCEVEDDGKVLIRGVTVTGERRVCRYSQAFEMQSQNLCPPGHFSMAFKLPGPVDPQQFSGNFGTDGILEGIVMKEGQTM